MTPAGDPPLLTGPLERNPARLAGQPAKPGEVLVSDRALLKLNPQSVTAKNRRLRAKGAPKDLAAYVLTPASR